MGHMLVDINGSVLNIQPSKAVCIGRNYVDHIKELNNTIPAEPLLFMRPTTSLVALEKSFAIPANRGMVNHEIELAILIAKKSTNISVEQASVAFSHVALALDLTLRDLQGELKTKGYPWEKAKAFDGSCPISPFIPCEEIGELSEIEFSLAVNGVLRQKGSPTQMITPISQLISHISQHFTLLPGDIVLTGTPSGVGPLLSGDVLELVLNGKYRFSTRVKTVD